ncbi:AAA family ATPase [archaeon]|nr:MAG: AAA family ATPase [archaeon]
MHWPGFDRGGVPRVRRSRVLRCLLACGAVTRLIKANRLPHLLLYGPPGTGKTSTILAIAKALYGAKWQAMTLEVCMLSLPATVAPTHPRRHGCTAHHIQDTHTHPSRAPIVQLNASDDRGIDVVREQIKNFASTRKLFSTGVKLVILDEADAMTADAQFALRRGE